MKKFNSWLGDKLAFALATMTCFYFVLVLVIVPLFFQRPHDLVGWVQYIVQSIFQGISLPILAFVSRIVGDKQERILKETHDTVMQQLVELKETHQTVLQEMELLKNK